ncbi:tRNA 4-thiouridine(8) synthase ThiI [bacterium]|nr:tRNA 4-thiouridine(8) synthase ThiI [bacterium]
MKEQNFNSGHCKGLLLFSGGLDSLLAYYILKKQDIDIMALIFKTPFFTEEKTVDIAKKNQINFRIIELGQPYIDNILMKPAHGYGKNLNPCIDCHGYMITKAKEILEKEHFDFIATGEVLNQRPMSQNRKALMELEEFTGTKGLILRPLSAKLLPETDIEKEKCIKRDNLFSVNGRSRNIQFELAKEFGITNFNSPAGGCLLTDPGYSRKAKVLLNFFDRPENELFEMIKYGRMFLFHKTLIILGRNHIDNTRLMEFSQGVYFEPIDVAGPSARLLGDFQGKDKVFELIAIYSDAENGEKIQIKFEDSQKIDIIKDITRRDMLRRSLI